MSDPIQSLLMAYHKAILSDLTKLPHPKRATLMEIDPNQLEVYHFPQMWGSTALGFGGIGGQAMTTAYTTVITYGIEAVVYFNGRLAYRIERVNQTFFEDLNKHDMHEVAGALGRYNRPIPKPPMHQLPEGEPSHD